MDIIAQNEAYLRRIQLFLEDSEWDKAAEYCDRVLDTDPENAQAYLYLLMVDKQATTPDELATCDALDQNKNYKKALRFGDQLLVSMLTQLNEQSASQAENAGKDAIYQEAVQLAARNTRKALGEAIDRFLSIPGWRDADIQLSACQEKLLQMQAEQNAKRTPKTKKPRKPLLLISIGAAVLALGIFLFVLFLSQETVFHPRKTMLDPNDLLPAQLDGKWGYISPTGDILIQPQFSAVRSFSLNGLAPVEVSGKWGYIDQSGEIVIRPGFDAARSFAKNGLALVKIDSKWGFINKSGECVIDLQYSSAGDFADNGLAAVTFGNGWGYIDETAKLVIQPQFETARQFAKNGLAVVKDHSGMRYINDKGNFVIPASFDIAWDFAPNGLARVTQNGKIGYINTDGQMVIDPKFDGALDFAENGLAAVMINGLYGYIDEAGAFVIRPILDGADSFHNNGLALVYRNGYYGCINKVGGTVIDTIYGGIKIYEDFVVAEKEGKWGILDLDGTVVVDFQYEALGL